MAQRDKNGENASERIARKWLNGLEIDECNTRSMDNYGKDALMFYGSMIAYKSAGRLVINNSHAFSGSRLSNERKQALRVEAKRRDITIVEEDA